MASLREMKQGGERFRIEKLEERIAPAVANFHALPSSNSGTLNAAGQLTDGPTQAINGVQNWFGAASGKCA